MIYTTTFSIDEIVQIRELEFYGRIKSIWIISKGIRYEVRYFHDGKPEELYFCEEELIKCS